MHSVADPDAESGAFFTPGWVKSKDRGSWMNNLDHISS
jgi:hypothetical protein